MILKISLQFLAILALPLLAHAQPADAPALVEFRAALHDPIKPSAELFFADKNGTIAPLLLKMKDLSRPQLTALVNGSLVLYDKLAVDPKKPEASIAATCKIPTGTKRVMLIILPSPDNTRPAYKMVCIDDSAKEFPKGECRVLTLISGEAAIEAGEHKLPIHPGVITRVPPVKRVNEYNMAQTNFFYKSADTWVPITERQLQYLEGYRRIFILHVTPGAAQPTVTTLVDTTSPTAPLLTR
jgi:hypothetical protein